MLIALQALLRLFLVFLAAVGTWAGAGLELPNAASEAERHAASENLRDHAADVFARIEETGLANPPDLAPEMVAAAPAPIPAPVLKPVSIVPVAVTPAPKPAATVVPPVAAPLPPVIEIESAPPAPSWIETKLPESLYNPVEGAADEAAARPIDDEALARETTVNLVCVRKEGSALRITSGSGVVISPDGLIATDAHVAYFFLLGEDGVGCSITHPSYPIFGYPGQVVYISPDWVRQNEHIIGGTHTTATGEEDYAFVAFAPGAAPASLGDLEYAKFSTAEPVAEPGDRVTVAGYPGAASSPAGYGSSSRLKVDEVEIDDTDSFSRQTADILETGRTAVAAGGSSGGGAFKDGALVGLTVTVFQIGQGYGLNALSTSWINRDLKRDAGVSVAELIAEDPDAAAASFWDDEGEALAKIVRAALD